MKYMLLALVLSFGAYAKECSYESGKVTWTAFKTPKKVGVGAAFDKFTLKAGQKGTPEDLMNGATFSIDTKSINTGDKARDAKILSFFFKKIAITGKVVSAKAGIAEVELKMNDVSHMVIMPYTFDAATSELKLTSKIDVVAFALKDNLASLTKACMEKHEGVTWPDVDVQMVAKLKCL
ncbi:MAG: YceI family protein [Bacteriovoracaceae bacterium]|nr:YceI family protein [Bacteriovoracaceae bacterium]